MAVERVTFQGSNSAGLQENVVHFHNPDGAATHQQIAAHLQTNWIGPLLNIQSTSFRWVQMIITTVDSPGGITTTIPITPNQGTQAGDAAPPFVSALIKVVTAFPGRRGRGRIYLPGATIGLFSDVGRLTPGSYAAFQSLLLGGWRSIYLEGGSAPITLCVCGRADPSDFHLAIAIDVRVWASVQRRRNYLVGA